jgi:hypothetical protein
MDWGDFSGDLIYVVEDVEYGKDLGRRQAVVCELDIDNGVVEGEDVGENVVSGG